MRKPDIFDEIIQCLKTGEKTGADTSMDEGILRDLYARPVRKAAPQPARNTDVQPAGDKQVMFAGITKNDALAGNCRRNVPSLDGE